MKNQFVNIGFGSFVATDKIVSIVKPEAAPIKRMVQHAKETQMLVDATAGRRTRAVLVMNDGHVVISGIQVETIINRFEDKNKE
ncbi:DUF370 domain-containing protein [Anaerotalea alkaliphila]|uniref:Putative regulatory protein GXN74_03930 n=1 Tax=Anaerotalea alkaliphila TaxID=2662126 RepID=A0A7X5HUY4_9FIRM|nr:DUF370 domain-containing protein [Anaerotalea alkaliphila]NDL66896.1 DUF370 domain-containing protein [Anaerotalea alkaliphila]